MRVASALVVFGMFLGSLLLGGWWFSAFVILVMVVAGSATLWMAVLADTGASVIVVGNALRLLRAR